MKAQLQRKLQGKQADLEPGGVAPENAGAPPPSRPVPQTGKPGRTNISGEEMARIRNLPRVKEVTETFGGHIEEVRRSDDG